MVREGRPPAREPARSWLARRSTMATLTSANANSPANISPVGPAPTIKTLASGMVVTSPVVRKGRLQPARVPADEMRTRMFLPRCQGATGKAGTLQFLNFFTSAPYSNQRTGTPTPDRGGRRRDPAGLELYPDALLIDL